MMGWAVFVYRQSDGGANPATAGSQEGVRLSVWQTHAWGLKWLDELASAGKAIDLGGNGYPNRFTARAEHLLRAIEDPPDANEVWSLGEEDVVLDFWVGKTSVDHAAIQQCRPEEWLLVVAWDES